MRELDVDTKSVFIERLWAVTIKYISPLILAVIILYFGVYRLVAG